MIATSLLVCLVSAAHAQRGEFENPHLAAYKDTRFDYLQCRTELAAALGGRPLVEVVGAKGVAAFDAFDDNMDAMEKKIADSQVSVFDLYAAGNIGGKALMACEGALSALTETDDG